MCLSVVQRNDSSLPSRIPNALKHIQSLSSFISEMSTCNMGEITHNSTRQMQLLEPYFWRSVLWGFLGRSGVTCLCECYQSANRWFPTVRFLFPWVSTPFSFPGTRSHAPSAGGVFWCHCSSNPSVWENWLLSSPLHLVTWVKTITNKIKLELETLSRCQVSKY